MHLSLPVDASVPASLAASVAASIATPVPASVAAFVLECPCMSRYLGNWVSFGLLHLCVSKYIRPCVCPFYLSEHLTFRSYARRKGSSRMRPYLCPSLCLFLCPSLCLFLCPSLCPFLCPFLCPPLCSFISQSIRRFEAMKGIWHHFLLISRPSTPFLEEHKIT